ncbi:chromate resistance protein [candidate division KSB1 bacterium]|nr:chromate resistance protein [candidate division KSB1 bacterium]
MATFEFIQFGKRVKHGIPFDVPGAELGRQNNLSCFESIIKKHKISEPVIIYISKIVHDIDVNIWGAKITPEAETLIEEFKTIKTSSQNTHECLEKTHTL